MHFHNWFVTALVCSLLYFCRCDEECINADEDGTCLERCPNNTFVYLPGCDNVTMSQKTCRHPVAKSQGYLCDYTRCECHDPSIWDEAERKCVLLEECSDQSKVIEGEEKLKNEQNKIFHPDIDAQYYE